MLKQRRIFIVWLPLAAMWLIMGIEQPAITSVIARLGAEKINLAAFGIAFSFVLIMESPILQLFTATIALAADRRSYRRLLLFSTFLGGGMTLIHIAFGVTPLFRFLLLELLHIPENIVDPTRTAYLIMSPGALLVGYRRVWQGVLIRRQHTTVVAVAMLARVVAVGASLAIGIVWLPFSGAAIGAIAMTAGIFFSAVAAFIPARKVIRDELPARSDKKGVSDEEDLTWPRLLSFYTPLALTSFIGLAARPLLTMGLALAPNAIESLAVWPVLVGFLFLFTSADISFQEVVVSLYRGKHELAPLRRFAVTLAIASTGAFLLTALLPISAIWFRRVAGLSEELIGYTGAPMVILSAIPGLLSLVSWYRGILVVQRRTVIVTKAVLLNLFFLVVPVFIGARFLSLPGTVIASCAYVAALTAEMLFLKGKIFPRITHVEKNTQSTPPSPSDRQEIR